jgi:hypothetical protein
LAGNAFPCGRAVPQTSDHTSAEDEFKDTFPGFTLTHVLGCTTGDELGLAIAALEAIRACGGGQGLRPQQARALAGRLAALPGVDRATIEHQLLRRPASTSLRKWTPQMARLKP